MLIRTPFESSVANYNPTCISLLFGLITYLVFFKVKNNQYERIKKLIIIGAEMIMLFTVFATIIYIFKLKEDFSNGRVVLWKHSINIFLSDYSTKEKLIGVGPEMLRGVYSNLPADSKGRVFASSHSELIHILMSLGIGGLLSWILS